MCAHPQFSHIYLVLCFVLCRCQKGCGIFHMFFSVNTIIFECWGCGNDFHRSAYLARFKSVIFNYTLSIKRICEWKFSSTNFAHTLSSAVEWIPLLTEKYFSISTIRLSLSYSMLDEANNTDVIFILWDFFSSPCAFKQHLQRGKEIIFPLCHFILDKCVYHTHINI